MTGELMRDFNANGAAIGALSSMYFYTYAALQIPVGVLLIVTVLENYWLYRQWLALLHR